MKNLGWESNNFIRTRKKIFLENLSSILVDANIEKRAKLFEFSKITFYKNVINATESTGRTIKKRN